MPVTTAGYQASPPRCGLARGFGRAALIVLAAAALGACASHPPRTVVRHSSPPTPPPTTQVYFYPLKGQSAGQQDRDRYECYLWAKKQTGFDPSMPQLPPHQRVEVVPQPPIGHDTAAGAVTGAIIGGVVARPGRSAEGAVLGAMAGAVLGAVSDSARQDHAERVQARYDRRRPRDVGYTEQQASEYRRAMAACLEGRGYSVR